MFPSFVLSTFTYKEIFYINKAAIAIQTLLFCESGEGEWHSYLADDSKPSMTKQQRKYMTVDGIKKSLLEARHHS